MDLEQRIREELSKLPPGKSIRFDNLCSLVGEEDYKKVLEVLRRLNDYVLYRKK